jgi:trehalose 2-sulfotransferase
MAQIDIRVLGRKATEDRVASYVDSFLARAAAHRPGEERKKYLLLSTPRTGSNWLAHELRSEGELGYPYEWFSPVYVASVLGRLGRPFDRRHYIDLVLAGSTTPNGVFGLKAQLDQVIRLRNEQQFDLLELGFDKVIWLERRDVIAQAYSYVRSLKTNVFSRYTEQERNVEELSNPHLVVETSAVLNAAGQLTQWRETFERHFRSRADLCLSYEDIMAEGMDSAVSQLRQLLGLVPARRSPSTRDYEKQARPEDARRIADIRAYLAEAGPLPV